MRVLGVLALVLSIAACGGSKSIGAGGGATTTAPTITLPTQGRVLVLQSGHALLLHQGQSKVVSGANVLVVCVSHGVTVSTRTPRSRSGATVGRDVWKRGPRGTASLSVSAVSNGRVTADCR